MTQTVSDKIINCFYETSEDCVKVVDVNGILRSFNDNGLKIMEIDNKSDVINQSWLKFWTGDMAEPAREAFEYAKSGEPSYFEGFCPTLKGTMKYWQVSIVPIFDDSQKVESLLVTSKDVTNVVELKKRVESLEGQLAKLSEDSHSN